MSRKNSVIILVIMLFLFCGIGYDVTKKMSPTYDEQNHLTRGIAILKTGDFRLSFHHPPFANILSSVPVMIGDNYWWNNSSNKFEENVPSFEPENENFLNIWTASHETLYKSQEVFDGVKAIKISRLPTLLFAICAALIIFLWTKELFGYIGAILSTGIFLFDPNIIAHSTLTTTDMAATATILLSVYLLRKYIVRPSWMILIACGAAVGVAFLCKFSSIILLPIFALILLSTIKHPKIGKRVLNALWVGILMLVIAGFTVWAGYFFKVEKLAAKPGEAFSVQYSGKGNIPVPAKQYMRGIKTVMVEADGHKAYLNGVTDDTGNGWWYYFPATFVYKTNWIALILIAVTTILFILPKTRRKIKLPLNETLFLGIPIIIYLLAGFGLLGISLNLGVRHLLPIYPFIYIFIGALGVFADFTTKKTRIVTIVTLVTILFSYIAIIALNHPNYLSYFNLPRGDRYLIDSNYDWGQELEKLKDYEDERSSPVYLSYFGTTPPLGVRVGCRYLPGMGVMSNAKLPESIERPCYVAISATCLQGGKVYTGVDYKKFLFDENAEFVEMIGKTIYIYHID